MKLPDSMRHIQAVGAGQPDVLRLVTAPLPQMKSDEVLIRVQAAGVNRPDVLQRQGVYPPPPTASPILGLEVAGDVVAVGEAVTALKPGARVCALANGGGYAEYCAVPAPQCLPWPSGYDAIRAAALPETYFTVWANLFQAVRLARGESVLVHGGTSGIGVTAIQLAREFGARVYATAGSQEKCDACVRLGATAAINYQKADFAQRIRDLTDGQGVNVVLDIVGAPYTMQNLACLAMDGRLIQVGTMEGAKVEGFDLTAVMRRRLILTGSTMRPRSTAEKGRIAQALMQTVWPVLEAGRCGPVIHQVFPLAEAAAAHRLMESSTHIGKIMLTVAG
ncbi:MAG TPA: NAD(P)H-quinone oxidoreductase [Candidatus Methylomirabilis sp.]|nr:NAD(P)H-quinone oxidoreductase [Candidatus Methylomirabilis sp.]